MMHVTMRQLSTFEALARLKSFSATAEEMHVSQPTVSKQIKALHESVGVLLIEQIGKKIFLTEAGEALYETCVNWLHMWNRFEQTIADLKGLKQGRLSVCAVTTTKYFMPRLLGPFLSQYPDIDIQLEVVNRDRLLERLARNQDDLYIMGVPPENIEAEAEPFMDNPLVLVAPAAHPLARRKRIDFKTLAREAFLLRERGSGTRIALERYFEERNTPLKIRMELGSNEAILQAIIGGLGVALLSQSTLSFYSEHRKLAILNVVGFPLMRSWHTVRPRGKPLSVVANAYLEFLHLHIDQLLE